MSAPPAGKNSSAPFAGNGRIADRARNGRPDTRPLLVRSPWERRPIILLTSSIMFVAVFAVRQGGSDAEAGLALLYVFPVMLVALELGKAAGLAAAALATALTLVWATTTPVDLGFVGIATRAAVFAAAGLVAGRFSDHMRQVYVTQERLLDAGIGLARLGDADRVGQIVVDHAMDLPGVRGARLTTGTGSPDQAGEIGPAPERLALPGRDAGSGALEVELRGGAEERAAVAMLALQASVALENQRLLESEREEMRLRAALDQAEGLLVERGTQLQSVLEDQELERSHVAHELHEQAAQALAAVLFGLDVVERDVGSGPNAKRLAQVRTQVDATLASLRDLAVGLRPPILDAMGIVPALERLAGDGNAPGLGRVEIDLGAIEGRLTPELGATVYRVAEEALQITAGERSMLLSHDDRESELALVVRLLDDGSVGDVSTLRARVELLGGAVDVRPGALAARIPLEPAPGARDEGALRPASPGLASRAEVVGVEPGGERLG